MNQLSNVAIIGVGELAPKRSSSGQTTLGLIARASALALNDAGLSPKDIDGLLVSVHAGETPMHVPATVAEYLGLAPNYAGSCDLGGASAAGMVWRAAAAINAGMASNVLCVLGNTRDQNLIGRAANRNPIREFDVPYGASGANTAYAFLASAHMQKYGTTPEQLASIAVKERQNAQLNESAVFFGKPITIQDVLDSAMVASPLHLLEIVMPCAGAAALIVSGGVEGKSKEIKPVWLRGAGEKVTHRAMSQSPSLTSGPLKPAIASALEMSGLKVQDMSLLSLYDCYTIMVGIQLEDAGLVEQGAFGDFVLSNDFSHLSKMPINTHGGQLGCGQADLAGGMGHIVEAVHQLRGTAIGRQIPNAEFALVTGNGATMSEATALVLGSHNE
jgi:acetyl-CoA acetyltransferase